MIYSKSIFLLISFRLSHFCSNFIATCSEGNDQAQNRRHAITQSKYRLVCRRILTWIGQHKSRVYNSCNIINESGMETNRSISAAKLQDIGVRGIGDQTGPKLNIKMSPCEYKKSYCGNKTFVRSYFLSNGNSYTNKTLSLNWISSCTQQSWPVSLVNGHDHWIKNRTPTLTAGVKWAILYGHIINTHS